MPPEKDQGGPAIHPSISAPAPAVPRPRRLATARSVGALILREMVTTYGRSPGGYIWAVLEPVAAIGLLAFAFSLAFRAPSLGTSFPLFYATGYLPYMLFHDVSGKTAGAIRFSRPLMNFGAISWFDVALARFLLNLFTHLVIFVLVIAAMAALLDTRAVPAVGKVTTALAMAAVLAAGTGMANAYLFLAFPAWERIWTVMTRPLFIVSGVFFLFEDVPAELRDVLWWNPIFHVTGAMRAGFYPSYQAAYVAPAYAFALGTGLLLLGLALLSRQSDSLVHK